MDENTRNVAKHDVEAVRITDSVQVVPKETYRSIPEYTPPPPATLQLENDHSTAAGNLLCVLMHMLCHGQFDVEFAAWSPIASLEVADAISMHTFVYGFLFLLVRTGSRVKRGILLQRVEFER